MYYFTIYDITNVISYLEFLTFVNSCSCCLTLMTQSCDQCAQADFRHLPFDDGHFEKVYAIESTVYSPSLYAVYSEVFRVLKPGGLFALYECIVTNKYNATDPYHRKLKAQVVVSAITGLVDL